MVYSLEEGRAKPFLSLKPDGVGTPAVSHDGHWLYYTRATEEGTIWMGEM
ncbi:MAG: hypothetical protein ACOC1F_10710 [Myxococcota bacterium]